MPFESRSCVNAESGLALPTVVIVLSLLAFMVAGAVTLSRDEFKASLSVRDASVAQYAAQAGAEYVLAHWDTLGLDTLVKNPGDTLDLGWRTLEGGARYRAKVKRTDGGTTTPTFAVSVEGRARGGGGRPRWIVVNLEGRGDGSRFRWALFAKDRLSIGGGGTITGPVGSNGDLTLDSDVIGDVMVGGTVDHPELVTGTVTEGAAHLPLDTIPCPTTPFGPPPEVGTVDSWDPTTGEIELGHSGDVTFTGGTYFYSAWDKGGNDYVRVAPAAKVIIYISDKFETGGNGFSNPAPNTAANLQVYGCGSSTTDWKYNGNGEVRMAVYAPTHKIAFGGNGDRHGSFVVRELTKSGNANVVYDSSLASVAGGGGGGFHVVAGSWTAVGR